MLADRWLRPAPPTNFLPLETKRPGLCTDTGRGMSLQPLEINMDNPNVTSRRAVLKGLPAAAAVAAVPGIALAQSTGQLAALLATYNAAHEDFCAAIDPLDEAEERLKKLPPVMVPLSLAPDGSPGSGVIEFDGDNEAEIATQIERTHAQLRDRFCGKMANRMVPEHVDAIRAALDASEAACIASLKTAEEQRQAQRDASGVTAAQAEWHRTCAAEDAAALAIISYVPASPAEATAKVGWLLKLSREMVFGGEEIEALIHSIAGEA